MREVVLEDVQDVARAPVEDAPVTIAILAQSHAQKHVPLEREEESIDENSF